MTVGFKVEMQTVAFSISFVAQLTNEFDINEQNRIQAHDPVPLRTVNEPVESKLM